MPIVLFGPSMEAAKTRVSHAGPPHAKTTMGEPFRVQEDTHRAGPSRKAARDTLNVFIRTKASPPNIFPTGPTNSCNLIRT
jgi:hypothetical protein